MIDIKFTYNLPIHIENKKYETALFFGHLNGIFGNTDSDGRFTVFQDPYDVLVTLVSGNTKIWFVVCTEEEKLYVNSILKSTLFQKLVERRIKVNIQKTYPYILDIIIDTKSLIKNNVRITVANDNDKAFKEINKRKFDVCLMNPPYGERTSKLHLDFTKKCIETCDTTVCIMPKKIAFEKTNDSYNSYKDAFNMTLNKVEEVDSNVFNVTILNVGIYYFNNKHENDNITLKYIDGTYKSIKSLYDVNNFSAYELNFVKYVENITPNVIRFAAEGKRVNKIDNLINACINKITGNFILTTAEANGAMNGSFFSSITGNIYNRLQLKGFLKDKDGSGKAARCMLLQFDSLNEAQNCKVALSNPVLRFCLLKVQSTQSLTKECYQYVPNINWSDPRVVTDEGLLEVCGCPKNKCKEYADYCFKYMENFDKKKK